MNVLTKPIRQPKENYFMHILHCMRYKLFVSKLLLDVSFRNTNKYLLMVFITIFFVCQSSMVHLELKEETIIHKITNLITELISYFNFSNIYNQNISQSYYLPYH